uniref:B30.2/SPRY domain-containing protein n=1 Tax=Globodera pallida TaxID=36090 RepID=A0A183BWG9_GLOPA
MKKKHLFSFERQKLLLVCPRNRLNAKDSSSDLCVIRSDCLTVYRHGKVTRSDVCSVRAELVIPRHHRGVFYYEVKIVKLDRWVLVGLAEKSTPLDYEGIVHIYGYTSIGEFWGHSVHGCEYYKNVPLMKRKDEFGVGDIVGCGLNLATHTTDLLVHQSDLYPYITLKDVADKVTANFGPQFEYNIPEEYLRSEE